MEILTYIYLSRVYRQHSSIPLSALRNGTISELAGLADISTRLDFKESKMISIDRSWTQTTEEVTSPSASRGTLTKH